MLAIASQPLRSARGYWIIEFEQAFALVSAYQISGLLPKAEPFITAGYWDDICLAGSMVEPGRKLAVLGAGIGSFLPFLGRNRPDLEIQCVEASAEIRTLGERLRRNLGVQGRSTWFIQSALELPNTFWSGVQHVFVDLYDSGGIADAALAPSLHRTMSRHLREDGLIFLNISDPLFDQPSLSTTHWFMDRLRQFYRTFLILRRPASSTLICGNAPAHATLERVRAQTAELDPRLTEFAKTLRAIHPGDRMETDGERPRVLDHLKFRDQYRAGHGFDTAGEGLAPEVARFLSQLDPKDLLRLARNRSLSQLLSEPGTNS